MTTAAATTVAGLAGCLGGDDDTGGGSDSDGDGAGDNADDRFDGWFDDVPNYEGVDDRTGEGEVRVDVGAGNGLQFEPPAIEVDPGTTVVWEWTGDGGQHDVSAEDATFESELTADPGHTFEHTFEAAGTYRYYCTPHRTVEMKGAVVVTE